MLAVLSRHREPERLVRRAEELFRAVVDEGWDHDRGGFYYSLDLDMDPVIRERYSWEVAEAIGAAAVLSEQTNDDYYTEWYGTFWSYAVATMVHPENGNWYTKVTETNESVPTKDGIVVEPGYQPIGACLESLCSLG